MDERSSMNAKGSKMGKSVRSCGRWGVWVCTGLMIAAIPVSFWTQPGVKLVHELSDKDQSVGIQSIHFAQGRAVFGSVIPQQTANLLHQREPNPQATPGWRVKVVHRFYGIGLWTPNGSWWKPKLLDDRPFAVRWDLPLLYPVVFMLGWSLWLVRGRRKLRRRVGCCSECGYSLDGLTSDVCPECGETHEA